MVSRPQAMTFSTDLQIQNIPAMIDLQWLLTGKGDMLKTKSSQSQKTGGNNPNSTGKDNNNSSLNQTFTTDIVDKFLAIIKNKDEKQSEVAHSAPENSPEGIPLIPLSAMAGAFTGETSVMEYECERYVIPAFKGADFLIQVKGDSMRPPLIIRATSWPASVSPCQTCFSNGIKYMSSIPTKGHSSNVSNPEATESIF